MYCRDQPGATFDFPTWFEFAVMDEGRVDELLVKLRAAPERRYAEREAEIRPEKTP